MPPAGEGPLGQVLWVADAFTFLTSRHKLVISQARNPITWVEGCFLLPLTTRSRLTLDLVAAPQASADGPGCRAGNTRPGVNPVSGQPDRTARGTGPRNRAPAQPVESPASLPQPVGAWRATPREPPPLRGPRGGTRAAGSLRGRSRLQGRLEAAPRTLGLPPLSASGAIPGKRPGPARHSELLIVVPSAHSLLVRPGSLTFHHSVTAACACPGIHPFPGHHIRWDRPGHRSLS